MPVATLRRPLVLVVLLALTSTGCLASERTRASARALDERLGDPGWTTSVEVSAEGTDVGDVVTTAVDLRGDVTGAEIAALVTAYAAAADTVGLPTGSEFRILDLYLADSTRLHLVVGDDVDADAVRAGAERWLGVCQIAEGVRGLYSVLDERDGSVFHLVDVEDDAGVGAFYDRLGARPELTAPGDRWSVRAPGVPPPGRKPSNRSSTTPGG